MNPISQGRTPNQANTYREMYISSLMLDISNMAKTLNASRGIVSTGSSGAPPVDGRTITEKYADLDALKVMIRGQLKEITDGQNAQDIVYELTSNELEFLVGILPFVITDLKPKFQLGVPAEVFIPYLRKLMRKTIETKGVEYGLQEAAGGGPGGGGLPPPSANNIMPVVEFERLMYDLDDILAIPEEGDLQSVGSFASSVAPSEASSRYSQPRVDFGAQFGAPSGRAPPAVRPTILRMRDMIHRDMLRIIDNWPSLEDQQAIEASEDPFLVESYQETVADFADTMPLLRQMAVYRDALEQSIASGDQAQAEQIIKEWSSIVSNINYNVLEDAKAIVRQAKEKTLNLDKVPGDEPLFPEDADDFLSSDAVIRYFDMLQTAPQTASSIVANPSFGQSQVSTSGPEELGQEGEEMTEMTTLGEEGFPVITFRNFSSLSLQNKRDYLTLIGEIIPAGALDEFFDEVADGEGTEFKDGILDAFDDVYPTDEGAMGTDESLDAVYEAMLQSVFLELGVGEPLISDPKEIAALPNDLVRAILPELQSQDDYSPEDLAKAMGQEPLQSFAKAMVQEPLDLTRETDFNIGLTAILMTALIDDKAFDDNLEIKNEAKQLLKKGTRNEDIEQFLAKTLNMEKNDIMDEIETPNPLTKNYIELVKRSAKVAEVAEEPIDVFAKQYGGENPYKFATAEDYAPGGRFGGEGLSGGSHCMSGRGMCGCMRCNRNAKKMKAGKLPIGKGKNIIIGRGIMAPKITARVIPSNIDLSLGIKAEPAYVSFGKHLINKHRLMKDNVLMLRTLKGGVIANVPTQKVSPELSKILKTIINNGNPDFESLNNLTDEDKIVLYNISKTSRISQSVPNPNKSFQEQEDSRFELLKGQIASGQDNKAAIKEFKLLLVKMMNQKRIPRGQGIDILTEMAALGL